jgi:hypothetical protein
LVVVDGRYSLQRTAVEAVLETIEVLLSRGAAFLRGGWR